MKNFNILEFHWKIKLLGEEEFTKNQYKERGLPKGLVGQFLDLRGLGKKDGVVFLRGLIPQCTLRVTEKSMSSFS